MNRFIEAQFFDGALLDLWRCIWIDQNLDRIADGVHAQEHDDRHREDDDRSLHNAADEKKRHLMFPPKAETGGANRLWPLRLTFCQKPTAILTVWR